MKVSVEKLPTSEAVLNVDVTWDEMEKASEKAYRKLVQKVDIQGFRRGKAPRSILERRVGKEYIYQEGLDDLLPHPLGREPAGKLFGDELLGHDHVGHPQYRYRQHLRPPRGR